MSSPIPTGTPPPSPGEAFFRTQEAKVNALDESSHRQCMSKNARIGIAIGVGVMGLIGAIALVAIVVSATSKPDDEPEAK